MMPKNDELLDGLDHSNANLKDGLLGVKAKSTAEQGMRSK
jgi:hypothetical protein